jgi:hypothetical protein
VGESKTTGPVAVEDDTKKTRRTKQKDMKILYVGRDKAVPVQFCAGSLVCLSLVEKINERVEVQDCSILRMSQKMPEWLNGTPIYVDQRIGQPARGTEAVRELQNLLRQEDELNREKNNVPQRPHSMQTLPPVHTRQPSSSQENPHRTEGRDVAHGTGTDLFVNNGDGYDGLEPQDATANGSSSNAPIRQDKVTEDDLQRYMEQRKATEPPTKQILA